MEISNVARLTAKLQMAEIFRDKRKAYINGEKASNKALRQLEQDSKAGKVRIYGRTTKSGNVSFRTEG